MKKRSCRISLWIAGILLFFCGMGRANTDDAAETASSFKLVKTIDTATVYSKPLRRSFRIARIQKGAVIRVVPTSHKRGCRKGWLMREHGGYVCAAYVKSVPGSQPSASLEDEPNIRRGTKGYLITRGGAALYKKKNHIETRKKHIFLYKGSILTITDNITRYGSPYLITRQGMYARAENSIELPEPIVELGLPVAKGANVPGGIVIDDRVPVYAGPDENSEVRGFLSRWSVISNSDGTPLHVEREWIAIPTGGYVKDSSVARYRPAPIKFHLREGEKWISVDLKEQLLVAHEGHRVVRIVPCSTGIKGNTSRGIYRIHLKRRMQTLNLRGGHERVEDVQWVMYYDRKRAIAIHTAYWHGDFGKPKSHGCVNVPQNDARWIYEWSTPTVHLEDSENFHSPIDEGTRVMVF